MEKGKEEKGKHLCVLLCHLTAEAMNGKLKKMEIIKMKGKAKFIKSSVEQI